MTAYLIAAGLILLGVVSLEGLIQFLVLCGALRGKWPQSFGASRFILRGVGLFIHSASLLCVFNIPEVGNQLLQLRARAVLGQADCHSVLARCSPAQVYGAH